MPRAHAPQPSQNNPQPNYHKQPTPKSEPCVTFRGIKLMRIPRQEHILLFVLAFLTVLPQGDFGAASITAKA
ncbi:hypothetical protein GJ744_007844 [Endocarpon pusillum]|uniref:Uncharacterized protein n=1 Tax=Endocarpon pusillum TaxID=364733 RepID=A0A8H7EA15_9EURO|nr:hypothetical protein GJ744_007844 [Endocarpon pusillum]